LLEFGGEFVEAHGESPGKISDTRQMRTPLNISTSNRWLKHYFSPQMSRGREGVQRKALAQQKPPIAPRLCQRYGTATFGSRPHKPLVK